MKSKARKKSTSAQMMRAWRKSRAEAGSRSVTVMLSAQAAAALDLLREQHGSNAAALENLLRPRRRATIGANPAERQA